MSQSFTAKMITFEYHVRAYRFYGYVSKVCTALHVFHPYDMVSDIQRKATINAHTHRVRAEKLIQRPVQ